MLSCRASASSLQSIVDLYSHFPPKGSVEAIHSARQIKNIFNTHSFSDMGYQTMVLHQLCLPLAISHNWVEAAAMFQEACTLDKSGPSILWAKTLGILQNIQNESVFRFLRHAAQHSEGICRVIEELLRFAQALRPSSNSCQFETLIKGMSQTPPKHISQSFAEVLYTYAIQTRQLEEVSWIYKAKRIMFPPVLHLQAPNTAYKLLRLSLQSGATLCRSEVAQVMRRLLTKLPDETNSLLYMARQIDSRYPTSAESIYQEARIEHFVHRNEWKSACNALRNAMEHGIQSSPLQIHSLSVHLLKQGRWETAQRLLQSHLDVLPNIPLRPFSEITKLFIRHGALSIAHSLMQFHSPFVVNDYALSNLLHFLAQDGEWAMLLSIYENLRPKEDMGSSKALIASPASTLVQQSTLASTAIGYENFMGAFTPKQWKAAIATYQLMVDRSVLINYKVLTKLLRLCCRANRWEPALSIYTKVHKVHTTHRSIDLYAGYMTGLHECLYSNSKWELSAALLNAAVVFPTEASINICLAGVTSAGRWELASKIIQWMIQDQQKLSCISVKALRTAVERSADGKRANEVYLKALGLSVTQERVQSL